MNIEDLKSKALAATPGPWCAQTKDHAVFTTCGQPDNWMALARKDEDCEFIAAANPAAILELIAELEAVKSERDELKNLHDAEIALAESRQETIYSLRARIETAEKQEPAQSCMEHSKEVPCEPMQQYEITTPG